MIQAQYSDPVFGQLEFDGSFWVGEYIMPSGLGLEVMVDPGLSYYTGGEAAYPTEQQRKAFVGLLRHREIIHRRAEEAIYKCLEGARAFLENPLIPDQEPLPPLPTSRAVWDILEDPGVIIPPQGDEPTAVLYWYCRFEPSGGVQVIVRNDDIESVGPMEYNPFYPY
jgi:hypothetical protein